MKLLAVILLFFLGSIQVFSQSPLLECAYNKALEISDEEESYKSLIKIGEAFVLNGDQKNASKVFHNCLDFTAKFDSSQSAAMKIHLFKVFHEIIPKEVLVEYLKFAPMKSFQLEVNESTLPFAVKLRSMELERRHRRYEWGYSYQQEELDPAQIYCNNNWKVLRLMRSQLMTSKKTMDDYNHFLKLVKLFKDTSYTDLDGVKYQCIDYLNEQVFGQINIGEYKKAAQLIVSSGFKVESNEMHLYLDRQVRKLDFDGLAEILLALNMPQFEQNMIVSIVRRLKNESPDYRKMRVVLERQADFIMNRKAPKDGHDLYRFEEVKLACAEAFLIWDEVDKSMEITNSIKDPEKKSKGYLNVATWYRNRNQRTLAELRLETALKYVRKAEIDNFTVVLLSDIALGYYYNKNEEKSYELLQEAVRMSKKVNSKTFEEYSLEDVAIAMAKRGLYDEVMKISSKLSNDGSGSRRSSAEEEIYQRALINGDTTKASELIDLASEEVNNIGHIYQRQWYRRQVALAYAKLGKYRKAMEVANQLETNTFDYVDEFTKGFVEIYEERESHAVPISFIDSLFKLVTKPKYTDQTKPLKFLIEYCVSKHLFENTTDFQNKILQVKYGTTDLTKMRNYKVALWLFSLTEDESGTKTQTLIRNIIRKIKRPGDFIKLYEELKLNALDEYSVVRGCE